MGDWKTVTVEAYIEVNVANIVQEIMSDYGCEMNEIDREMVSEFVSDHTSYLTGKNTDAIRRVSDGTNLDVWLNSELIGLVIEYIEQNQ